MCYLTVELLELVDKCISLEGSIEGDELLERKVGVLPGYLTVELLELMSASALKVSNEGDELPEWKVCLLPDC